MFKIKTLTRSKIKILTFSKTKYISDWEEWGGQPAGLSNSDAANCLIHLVWSWFLTSVINILTVGFHYMWKFDILIESKFLSLLM